LTGAEQSQAKRRGIIMAEVQHPGAEKGGIQPHQAPEAPIKILVHWWRRGSQTLPFQAMLTNAANPTFYWMTGRWQLGTSLQGNGWKNNSGDPTMDFDLARIKRAFIEIWPFCPENTTAASSLDVGRAATNQLFWFEWYTRQDDVYGVPYLGEWEADAGNSEQIIRRSNRKRIFPGNAPFTIELEPHGHHSWSGAAAETDFQFCHKAEDWVKAGDVVKTPTKAVDAAVFMNPRAYGLTTPTNIKVKIQYYEHIVVEYVGAN